MRNPLQEFELDRALDPRNDLDGILETIRIQEEKGYVTWLEGFSMPHIIKHTTRGAVAALLIETAAHIMQGDKLDPKFIVLLSMMDLIQYLVRKLLLTTRI